jgi:hypothetical protein
MGCFQKREITASGKQADLYNERTQEISQLTRFSGGDHRLEKATHRSDKVIGINAVVFFSSAPRQLCWRGFEIPAEHVDLQDAGESVVSIRHTCSQLASMSCY